MQNSNRQYMEQSINTMTKGEMLIFLYNEAIKRLTKAKILGYNNDYAAFEFEVGRTREIIDYLVKTLDRKYPISQELFKLYDFINFELSRSKASRNVEIIDEVLPFIVELRDTWKEADKLSKGIAAYGQ